MLELLKKLCALPCVSGDEPLTNSGLFPLIEHLGAVETLPNGSVICRMNEKADLPTVMLTAHLDRIGLMVTRISDKGFIHMAAVGGIDRRNLAGARVALQTKSGILHGVVCSTPPHLSSGDGKLPSRDDVAVDMGLTAERARELIGYGDRGTLEAPFTELLGDRVCSPALDDRAGCAVIIRVAELLKNCDKYNIVLAFAAQEETAGGGAQTAANYVKPDFCFVVDVTFGDVPDEAEGHTVKFGGGPAVGFAPILDKRLSEKLIDTANAKNIPWSPEVMGERTGTDADTIVVSGRGVRTGLVSIPQRYMHTTGEIVTVSDCENTALLIAETIGGGL